MKELYTLAVGLKFQSKKTSLWYKDDEYLWMCELQRWLREVHKLEVHIEPAWDNIERTKRCYCPWVNYTKEEEDSGLEDELPEFFDTYELALESALLEALKLIK